MPEKKKPLTLVSLQADYDALYRLFKRVLFWAAIGLAGFLLGLALMVLNANRQVRDINAARADAKVTSCNATNDLIDGVNGVLLSFGEARSGQPRTPEQQKAIDDYLHSKELPRRNCTPAGIRAFYEGDHR